MNSTLIASLQAQAVGLKADICKIPAPRADQFADPSRIDREQQTARTLAAELVNQLDRWVSVLQDEEELKAPPLLLPPSDDDAVEERLRFITAQVRERMG